MSAEPEDDVTRWIARLGAKDEQAAQVLWEKYFHRLVEFARRRLDGTTRRTADEEDVALSAMHSFCRGMAEHRFADVKNRDDLWKLLVTITARKASSQRRHHAAQKRGGGQVRGESVFQPRGQDEGRGGIDQVLGGDPSPEFANMVAENCQHMLDVLDDPTLRQVALLRLEGLTNDEIAARLDCVTRTVERKLERVRAIWSQEGLR